MRTGTMIVIGLLVVAAIAQGLFVFGADPNGAQTNRISTAQYVPTTAAGSDVAEGGNVTRVDLSTNATTARWAGYYGNLSGELKLGSGTNVLYDFGAGTSTAVAIYASTNQNFNFGVLEAATGAGIDTAWSFVGGADLAATVFDGVTTEDIEGLVVPVVELETAGNDWFSGIFDNNTPANKNGYAFGSNTSISGKAGFDGVDYQYQLMVPTTESGTDTYYFFLSV